MSSLIERPSSPTRHPAPTSDHAMTGTPLSLATPPPPVIMLWQGLLCHSPPRPHQRSCYDRDSSPTRHPAPTSDHAMTGTPLPLATSPPPAIMLWQGLLSHSPPRPHQRSCYDRDSFPTRHLAPTSDHAMTGTPLPLATPPPPAIMLWQGLLSHSPPRPHQRSCYDRDSSPTCHPAPTSDHAMTGTPLPLATPPPPVIMLWQGLLSHSPPRPHQWSCYDRDSSPTRHPAPTSDHAMTGTPLPLATPPPPAIMLWQGLLSHSPPRPHQRSCYDRDSSPTRHPAPTSDHAMTGTPLPLATPPPPAIMLWQGLLSHSPPRPHQRSCYDRDSSPTRHPAPTSDHAMTGTPFPLATSPPPAIMLWQGLLSHSPPRPHQRSCYDRDSSPTRHPAPTSDHAMTGTPLPLATPPPPAIMLWQGLLSHSPPRPHQWSCYDRDSSPTRHPAPTSDHAMTGTPLPLATPPPPVIMLWQGLLSHSPPRPHQRSCYDRDSSPTRHPAPTSDHAMTGTPLPLATPPPPAIMLWQGLLSHSPPRPHQRSCYDRDSSPTRHPAPTSDHAMTGTPLPLATSPPPAIMLWQGLLSHSPPRPHQRSCYDRDSSPTRHPAPTSDHAMTGTPLPLATPPPPVIMLWQGLLSHSPPRPHQRSCYDRDSSPTRHLAPTSDHAMTGTPLPLATPPPPAIMLWQGLLSHSPPRPHQRSCYDRDSSPTRHPAPTSDHAMTGTPLPLATSPPPAIMLWQGLLSHSPPRPHQWSCYDRDSSPTRHPAPTSDHAMTGTPLPLATPPPPAIMLWQGLLSHSPPRPHQRSCYDRDSSPTRHPAPTSDHAMTGTPLPLATPPPPAIMLWQGLLSHSPSRPHQRSCYDRDSSPTRHLAPTSDHAMTGTPLPLATPPPPAIMLWQGLLSHSPPRPHQRSCYDRDSSPTCHPAPTSDHAMTGTPLPLATPPPPAIMLWQGLLSHSPPRPHQRSCYDRDSSPTRHPAPTSDHAMTGTPLPLATSPPPVIMLWQGLLSHSPPRPHQRSCYDRDPECHGTY